jgi:hypothetical protein
MDIPEGLSFDQDDLGFVLREKKGSAMTAIHFSEAEFWGLKGTIARWSDRILAQAQAKSGAVQVVVAHPIAQIRAMPDAMRQNVLATLAAPSGEQTTFQFPPDVADALSFQISAVLRDISQDRPVRQ